MYSAVVPGIEADRLLPAEPGVRAVARDLYQRIAARPILSPHGHVDPAVLVDDRPFSNPADLLVTNDHYVTRLLHANGVPLAALGIGEGGSDPREIWRAFADHWHVFAGTASGYWLEYELRSTLGIDTLLTPDSADVVYDLISARVAEDDFRPRALFTRFGIEVLATTDDPLDDLRHHAALRRADLGGRVVPTFRPDAYIDARHPHFAQNVARLLEATSASSDFAGYLDALRQRREYFAVNGAVSTDHGVASPHTLALDADEAARLFDACRAGTATSKGQAAFSSHMLWQMANMSVDDGLVMTIHAGVLRNHHSDTYTRYGPDTGHDIPIPTTFVEPLRPLLESFGLAKDFHLVLFTVDESTFSRELAPLAGFYPSVYVGAPWWFLDAPDAILRFRGAATESAGFYKTSGFIDDTRAFLSIPARHDTARRSDAGYLARLVAQERLSLASAERIIDDLVDAIPRKVFKL